MESGKKLGREASGPILPGMKCQMEELEPFHGGKWEPQEVQNRGAAA